MPTPRNHFPLPDGIALYALPRSVVEARVAAAELETPAMCLTLALQYPAGHVGFADREGEPLLRAMVDESLAIERADRPDWARITRDTVESRFWGFMNRCAVTCARPSELVLRELETVRANAALAKKNAVLARHGRPLFEPTNTRFDRWIVSARGVLPSPISSGALRFLVENCESIVSWSTPDGWLAANVVASSAEAAWAPARMLERSFGVEIRRVSSEREMPTW